MDYEKIKTIFEQTLQENAKCDWTQTILIFLFLGILATLGAYLKKKGQNLATKGDISEITEKIEDIRSKYNQQLEEYKASLQLSNQLKLTSLEARLQKHQEAYTLWRKLLFNLRNEETIYNVIDDCQTWWETNCLYLTEDARASFHRALFLAGEFRNLSKSDPKAIKEWHFQIKEAGDKILKAVNLPSLGEDETKKVVTKIES